MRRVARSVFWSRRWVAAPLAALCTAALAAACGIPATSGTPTPTTAPTAAPTQTTPAPTPPATSPPTTADPSSPPAAARVLALGMSGPDVADLQRTLTAWHYYPGQVDGKFGSATLEAVWAFQEVQGVATSGEVDAATARAMASPREPAKLVPAGGGTRVEISLGRRVLVLYLVGQVALISHVSTGGGYYYCSRGGCGYARTPVGNFATTAFMPGWVTVPLGQMYNPVFFIATEYAIHGSADVPLEPASHGCVRIPMGTAEFFHDLVPVPGTPVYIR